MKKKELKFRTLNYTSSAMAPKTWLLQHVESYSKWKSLKVIILSESEVDPRESELKNTKLLFFFLKKERKGI